MLQAMVRGSDLHPVRVESGERLVFGRDPHGSPQRPGRVALRLPGCAPHVSGVLAELVVGHEAATLRWLGAGEGRLSSLLDAPGGARRVTLVRGMSAMLDQGKNELVVLAGKQVGHDLYTDLLLTFAITAREASTDESLTPSRRDTEHKPHIRKGQLARYSKEWYVALALAEPWLTGDDDSPFPPTNRRIYERVREWRAGNAWNLDRTQRVDDAIRVIARVAFGELADPYSEARQGRIQNPRFAVGKRIAEYRLVTAEDLAEVHHARP
jgi:hypothetical protein